MLAKRTSKNQLTLPKAVVEAVGSPDHFEVVVEDGRIVLTPLRPSRTEQVWAKLEKLGLTEQDVDDAVAWARGKR